MKKLARRMRANLMSMYSLKTCGGIFVKKNSAYVAARPFEVTTDFLFERMRGSQAQEAPRD
jgi:hypothetical protein